VTYVSSFPATARGMARLLKNDKLVASLSGNDAPYQVHADLTPDPQTVSRYRWTSSSGPPIAIESGTLCSANILVDERRPVELVVPYVRKATGI
jgi:HlyD family secretion protein